ncbi:MAG: HPr(Ser) kinase/phosphatase [Verrucomicrobiota bacterium]
MALETKDKSVSVREFFEAAKTDSDMELEEGEAYLDNIIEEGSMNRPGLALAGFFQYFAYKRVQVIGLAEASYLKSLPKADCERRLDQFFRSRIPCVVMSRNRHSLPGMKKLAQECRVPLLRSPMITKHFITAATITLENLMSPRMKFQGTMIDIRGMGVLIHGEPGIGKSETALALVERGNSFVSDDLTILRRTNQGAIVGSASDATRYHMEIRGLGIIHVPSLFGVSAMRDSKRLDLIIELVRLAPGDEIDRTGLDQQTRNLLGVEIPFIRLPVAPGRDITHVVEVAALNQRLKILGHDAAKELDEKLMRMLARKGLE